MTIHLIKLLDVVQLQVDLPQYNLSRGQIGTVVDTLANGKAVEVEFSDQHGRTLESIWIYSNQISLAN